MEGKKSMKEGCLNMEERESMSNVQLRCRYCIAQSIVGGAVLSSHPFLRGLEKRNLSSGT